MKPFAESDVDERQRWPGDICVHCCKPVERANMTREHVPSRCLLVAPFSEDLMTMTACRRCNEGYARDEQYLSALLTAVLAGSTDPDRQRTPKAGRMFKKQPGLRARIAEASIKTNTLFGESETRFWPEIDRVSRVVIKNARGHAVYELDFWAGNDPAHFVAFPLQSLSEEEYQQFEAVQPRIALWPEIGTRMFQRLFAADQSDMSGPWVIVQEGVYRYAVMDQGDGLLVRSIIREYLATEVYWSDGTY